MNIMQKIREISEKHGALVFFVEWGKPVIVLPKAAIPDGVLFEVTQTDTLSLRVAKTEHCVANGDFYICTWWDHADKCLKDGITFSIKETTEVFEFQSWIDYICPTDPIEMSSNEFFVQCRIGKDIVCGARKKVTAKDIGLKNVFKNIAFEENRYTEKDYYEKYLTMTCCRTISSQVNGIPKSWNIRNARINLIKIRIPRVDFADAVCRYIWNSKQQNVYKVAASKDKIKIAECYKISIERNNGEEETIETGLTGNEIIQAMREDPKKVILMREELGKIKTISRNNFEKKFNMSFGEFVGPGVLLGWSFKTLEEAFEWHAMAFKIANEKIKNLKQTRIKALRLSPFEEPIDNRWIDVTVQEVNYRMTMEKK